MKKDKVYRSNPLKRVGGMKSDTQQPTTIPTPTLKPTPTLRVEPQYGGVVRIANTWLLPSKMGVPGKINIGLTYLKPIVEKLLQADRAGRIVPYLVESWEYSEDGLQLTLHVRKGVKFHDGTDLNAEAAKWNLLKSREFQGTLKLLSSVDVVDKYTILLNMKSYGNDFLPTLAYSGGWVVSPTAYKTYGHEHAMVNPVGTGPFKFVSYEPDIKIVVERFDDYWQEGKPYLDKIEMFYVKDMTTIVNMLRGGKVDAVVNINGASAVALKSEGYVLTVLPWTMEGLVPDSLNSDSPLADSRVRQAIEYAINRPAIVDALGHGYWRALTQLATEAVYGYNPGIEGRPYDPDKAKQLLAEAGYPNGFKTKLIGGELTELPEIFEAIKANLADVGIESEIEIADSALSKEYSENKTWHNGLMFRHFNIDPNFTWALFDFHSRREYGQRSVLRNFDNIIDEALQARDHDTLVKTSRRVVKHLYDEAIVIPLMLTSHIAASSTKVHDLGFFEGHKHEWTPWNAWIEH